jgi:hypothetical protein
MAISRTFSVKTTLKNQKEVKPELIRALGRDEIG